MVRNEVRETVKGEGRGVDDWWFSIVCTCGNVFGLVIGLGLWIERPVSKGGRIRSEVDVC